jgi:ferric-dicitrate binding protein FerR (iron transport regulator)
MRPEDQLDKIVAGIRDEQIDPAVTENAADRVSTNLRPNAPLRSCADFQALMPDYRAGKLSEARALLLKDHTRECIACRKALVGQASRPAIVQARTPLPLRWAIAAALVAAAGLTAWTVLDRFGPGAEAGRVTVQVADGMLYRVSPQGNQPLANGQEVPGGAEIRTAKDSGAVLRLRDGSLVEMRERSGFSVSATRKDLIVHLGRGSIIVQAAKRRSGHLSVMTRDCTVSVTGTVFSVNSGIKGSRVSVIEGEVRVAREREERVLRVGDQFASSPSMTPVAVQDEIAWSRNVDQHLELLREFSVLKKKLDEVPLPDVRYSSRLLDLLPAQTAVYAGIPNLGPTLAEAQQVFLQRVQESPVLRQWWEEKLDSGKKGSNFEQVIDKIRAFSDYLGEEIVIAAAVDETGKLQDPIILAEVTRPGLKEFLQTQSAELSSSDNLLLRPDLVAVSPNATALSQLARSLDGQASGGFADTPFGSEVAQAYRDGASLLFSADLERIVRQASRPATAQPQPFADMKYLLVEQKDVAGQTDTRAVLNFRGPRRGVASWLAAPAPIGALDFVSPEATFVTAFAVKNPADVVAELLAANPKLLQELQEAEAKLGMSFQNDLAGPLGAEFAFAMDGPVLPIPSWKLAMEVYDPVRLQSTIQKFIEVVNNEAALDGKPGVQLTEQAVGGRTWYSVSIPDAKLLATIDYTFVDGYFVAAPSRELVNRAIQYRDTGYTLTRSTGFASLLPQDRHANFSGLVYHNLGPMLGPLAAGLTAGNVLTPEQRGSLEDLSSEMKPLLVILYGEEDRITLATTGSLFGLGVGNFMGVPAPLLLSGMVPH